MEVVLVIMGIALLAAAAVGGALALGGAEIPQVTSVRARIALAVLGVVALLLGLFPAAAGKPTPADHDASVRSAPAALEDAPTASPEASPPPRPEEPLWHGTLLFDSAIDFDTTPPTLTSSSDPAMDVYAGNDMPLAPINQIITYGSSLSRVARWTQQTPPTASDCAALLQTHGVDSVHFSQGDQFCLDGRDWGRLVFIGFQGQQQDGIWEMDTTVWRSRD